MTEEPKAPSIHPDNIVLAEHARYVYRLNVPPGVPVERLLDPDYYAHTVGKFKPGFLIEALAQDGTYFANLLVRKVEKTGLHCTLLQVFDLSPKVKPKGKGQTTDYKIAFGGAHKWRVIRLSDNEVMHHGEPSEGDARVWLDDFLADKVPA